jgi:hypothetical protein
MANLGPPARRGDFYYTGALFADPGSDAAHPRASAAHLSSLLRPEEPNVYKDGRRPADSAPVKDPSWHSYASQLLHYGLPVTKSKNGAKVRLLTAMN